MLTAFRLCLGALLPVLLYSSLNILLGQSAPSWFSFLLISGYLFMAIPSVLYSVLLESSRKRGLPLLNLCIIGCISGGFFAISPFLVLKFEGELRHLAMAGAGIGLLIPLLLHPLRDPPDD